MTPEEWEDAYRRHGDEVFRLSLNVQVRRGDAVRARDWAAVAADTAGPGLTDVEIAERVGLPVDVARAIRLRAEKENAHPENRRLLYEIGNKPVRAGRGRPTVNE